MIFVINNINCLVNEVFVEIFDGYIIFKYILFIIIFFLKSFG